MILSALLCLSALSNIALSYLLWRSKKLPTPTFDAKALIHDLTRKGSSIIRLECLDPEGLMFRRPQL